MNNSTRGYLVIVFAVVVGLACAAAVVLFGGVQ